MFKTVHTVFFSATNITKNYVRLVAEKCGLPIMEHDLTGPAWDDAPLQIGRDEIAIFGAPVFSGRIPQLAAERFRRVKGNGGPAIAITSYGNRAYEDALLELTDIARENGFVVAGGAAPVGRHSLLPHIAAGRPDEQDIAEAESFAENCLEKLANTPLEGIPLLNVGGKRPYKEIPVSAWLPCGTDNCDKCQICVNLCPVGAIAAEDPESTTDACIRCGRCLFVCPQGARKIPEPVFAMMRGRIDPLAAERKASRWFV